MESAKIFGYKKRISSIKLKILKYVGHTSACATIWPQGSDQIQFLTSLRKLWAILDLNRGPKDYESSALTAELMAQECTQKYIVTDNILEFFLVNGIKQGLRIINTFKMYFI